MINPAAPRRYNPGFYDLLPSAKGKWVRIDQAQAYDIQSFPKKLGPSWTWTFWTRVNFNGNAGIYLLSRNSHDYTGLSCQDPQTCIGFWNLHISGDGSVGLRDTGGNLLGNCIATPSSQEQQPRYSRTARFFAVVVDAENEQVSVYIDHKKAIDCTVTREQVFEADSSPLPESYISLGHRPLAPQQSSVGHGAFIDLQQFRIYNGTALSDEEIRHIHLNALDPVTGQQMRQCSRSKEISTMDRDWVDDYGQDCSVYARNKIKFPSVCDDEEAQKNCPNTCSNVACFEGILTSTSVYLGTRVHKLDDESTVCLSRSAAFNKWTEYNATFVPTQPTITIYLMQEYVFASNFAELSVKGDGRDYLLKCDDPAWSMNNARLVCTSKYGKNKTLELLDDGGSSHAYQVLEVTPGKRYSVSVKFWLLSDGICDEESEIKKCSPSLALCPGSYDPAFSSSRSCLASAGGVHLSPFGFESACEQNLLEGKSFSVRPKFDLSGKEIHIHDRGTSKEECTKLTPLVMLSCSFAMPKHITQEIVDNQRFFLSFWVKAQPGSSTFLPNIKIFSSLVPEQLLMEIRTTQGVKIEKGVEIKRKSNIVEIFVYPAYYNGMIW
jgi:hypothetical protein